MNGSEPITPSRRSIMRPLIASITNLEWTQFQGVVGLRCALGIAIPTLLGFAFDNPTAALFGGLGAFSVGFGSFQGAYRSQAIPMLLTALGMACSVFVGTLTGQTSTTAVLVVGLWGFAGGLLVALGHSASFVGLRAIIALLIAGGIAGHGSGDIATDVGNAAAQAVFVLGGGLSQMLLVVMIWPLRRFSVERRSLSKIYRSLAAYSLVIPRHDTPPEPHTFAGTASPLADPQPFATSSEMFGFQALLDEAERIRAGLAAIAFHYQRLLRLDETCAAAVSSLTAQVLKEIAAALAAGREPRAVPGVSESLANCAKKLSPVISIEPLLAQLDAAWRTAGLLVGSPQRLAHTGDTIEHRRNRRRFLHETLATLRANLSFGSTAFRHALRLAATICIAQVIVTSFDLPRGYWVPLAVAVMLKPDFHDTFAASIARVIGTAFGVFGATALAYSISPGSASSIAIVLVFAWAVYALAGVNQVVFAVCLAGYAIFLLSFAGVSQDNAAFERITNTAIGGALALFAYIVWPTWTAKEMRDVLAAMLDSQADYLGALLEAHKDSNAADMKRVDELRRLARRARSNAEAIFEKTSSEPYGHHALKWRTVMGTLAANRRIALAALALRAGLQSEDGYVVPTIEPLAQNISRSLHSLAAAVRGESPPPEHLPIRELDLTEDAGIDRITSEEINMIVDGIKAIALLLVSERDENIKQDESAVTVDEQARTQKGERIRDVYESPGSCSR